VPSRTDNRCRGPYEALRTRSRELLFASLRGYLSLPETAKDAREDWRDVLIDLAPFLDCAKRIDVDAVGLFDDASVGLPDDVRRIAERFARRTDVTLEAFGWTLAMTKDGPCYQPTAAK
jgi:hypothetical protein